MADYEILAHAIEKKNISELLKSSRRKDGRTKDEFREIKIELDVIQTALGSALVKLGNTQVIAGVKAMLTTPYADTANKGSFMVGFETSPLSSPGYRLGPPQPEAIEISRMTDRVIRESQCLDLEKLCLIEGEKVWQIIIDLYSLDAGGNFYDAAAIAAYAALRNAKLPDTKIDEEGNVEILETKQPLELQSFPVSVTTYKIDDHFIVDAELKEELISDARITFGTTETHIVSGQKGGDAGIKSNDILDILKNSIKVAADLREKIEAQIE
jgi:exosome complex component RRP42